MFGGTWDLFRNSPLAYFFQKEKSFFEIVRYIGGFCGINSLYFLENDAKRRTRPFFGNSITATVSRAATNTIIIFQR